MWNTRLRRCAHWRGPGAAKHRDVRERPRHGYVTLGWRLLLRCNRCAAVVAFTALRRRHEHPMPAVGGEHTVEARQVDPGLWDQGGQTGNEVQGLEDDMRGAVTVGRRS